MRCSLLLVVLVLTGCASSRPPGTLPEPVTLAEVNRALAEQRATVYFADGREPERWYVEVGPETTRLLGKARVIGGPEVRRIPTGEIAQIEIDDSLSAGQGAKRGAGYGALSGLPLVAMGLYAAATCTTGENDYSCLGALAIPLGAGVSTVGGIVGAGAGAATTARRYPVTVYRAPVTRYPDAVLALMENEEAQMASR